MEPLTLVHCYANTGGHPAGVSICGRYKERALANGPEGENSEVKPFSVEPEAEIGDPSFTDLIACERDCRNCSYAAWLDCDGNCGECVHNGYCPCVNPVVARSKTALKIIELRPLLLQDLRSRR